jgi:hypothetical protein
MMIGIVLGREFSHAEESLPDAKPIPMMQAVPQPQQGISFQHEGRELTRLWQGTNGERPYLFPLNDPQQRSLTRMGHPHDPNGHGHHTSVWVGHADINGFHFWENNASKVTGKILFEGFERLWDADEWCGAAITCAWWSADQTPVKLIQETRTFSISKPDSEGNWLLVIDLEWKNATQNPLQVGATAFGPLGVRMAKSIGVKDGGGRILNSEGLRNEPAAFRKRARWIDYSGKITNTATGGITLIDHPENPHHPTPFHIRNDGWMGPSPNFENAATIAIGESLRFRYGLWVHAGLASPEVMESQWKRLRDLPKLVPGDTGKK